MNRAWAPRPCGTCAPADAGSSGVDGCRCRDGYALPCAALFGRSGGGGWMRRVRRGLPGGATTAAWGGECGAWSQTEPGGVAQRFLGDDGARRGGSRPGAARAGQPQGFGAAAMTDGPARGVARGGAPGGRPFDDAAGGALDGAVSVWGAPADAYPCEYQAAPRTRTASSRCR